MRQGEFGHADEWYIRHSKSIITNFLNALTEMEYLSSAMGVLEERQIETIANKCGFNARDLYGIFDNVDDLYENIY